MSKKQADHSPFGFDNPKASPGFLLWQTTTTWQRLIKKALEPHNISHAQFVIMALLLWFEKHQYDTTQVLIANWSKLDKMTVSKAVKRLVIQELVTRVEHKIDSRAKTVCLTHRGKELVRKLVPIIESVDTNFFETLPEQDHRSLIHILSQLT